MWCVHSHKTASSSCPSTANQQGSSLSFALKKKMEKEWPLGAFFESSTMAEVTILIIKHNG